ncbi:protein SprT [Thiohalobacter sp. COW1]|uniref:SprT family zinc-dependent metalloprotease n=1 Tax=Thiohalobacter sp. COW1 TaxID=2795687 RepID=UPI001915DD4B|nr:SprT-like domain-containing protein [Thiohalobacter sp. COW1]BCO32458.1 protein SprT [Thiohalobacter sp. COW1]
MTASAFRTTVAPITPLQQQQVREQTRLYLGRGNRLLERSAPLPAIDFDLRGRAAGQFRVRGGRACIRYNPWVFALDLAGHLRETVPHEVAHYLVWERFGRTAPHGREWRALMRAFGVTPRATGDYALDGVPVRRQRRHAYRCGCRRHALSTTRHNRARAGVQYRCRRCGESLEYCHDPAPIGLS